MSEYQPKTFSIIRHYGQANKGQLPDGTWVYAKDKVWFSSEGRFIPVAPYDDHFIYEVPPDILGPTWRCSCGSVGVIAGYSAYVGDASLQGLLVVCQYHAQFGHHLNGSHWV